MGKDSGWLPQLWGSNTEGCEAAAAAQELTIAIGPVSQWKTEE